MRGQQGDEETASPSEATRGCGLDHKPLMDSPMNEAIWIASYPSLKTSDMFMIDFFILCHLDNPYNLG